MINWLDYLLILFMVLAIALGYVQGLLRQVINLAAMYLGAILAAEYFRLLGSYFKSQLVTTPGMLLNAAAFFIIMFAVTGLLNFLTSDAYKNTKLTLFPVLDHLGGMTMGLVASWILIALAVNAVGYAASSQSWASAEAIRQLLRDGILRSLVAASTGTTLPSILDAIKPWLPAGLPTIFNI